MHGLTSEEIEVLVRRIVVNAGVVDAPPAADEAPDRGDQHLWDIRDAVPGALLVTGDARVRRSKRKDQVLAPVELTAG